MKKLLIAIVLINTIITGYSQSITKSYSIEAGDMLYFSRQVLDRINLEVLKSVVVDQKVKPYRNDSLVRAMSEAELDERLWMFSSLNYEDSAVKLEMKHLVPLIYGCRFTYDISKGINGGSFSLRALGVNGRAKIAGIMLGEEPMFLVSKEQLKKILSESDFNWLNSFAMNCLISNGVAYYPEEYSSYHSGFSDMVWGYYGFDVKDTVAAAYSQELFNSYTYYLTDLIVDLFSQVIVYKDSLLTEKQDGFSERWYHLSTVDTLTLDMSLPEHDHPFYKDTTIIVGGIVSTFNFVEKEGELFSIGFTNKPICKLWISSDELKKHIPQEMYDFLIMLYRELKRNDGMPFKRLIDAKY